MSTSTEPIRPRHAGRHLLAAALIPPALLLAGCSDATGPGGGVPEITELPRQLSSVEEEVIAASNRFALALTPGLLPQAEDENLFWSPLSASMSLGMLLNGADGDSFDQLRSVLGFDGLEQGEINDAYRSLTELLLGLDPTVTTEIGNSVWTRTGFPVEDGFRSRVTDAFDAEVAEVDFVDPATLARINGWASDATKGRIDPMFEDPFPPELVSLLLNAIYFEGSWTTAFDPDDTRRAPFTRPDGSTVEVDLMKVKSDFEIGVSGDVRLIDVPYGGRAFAMTVAMPLGNGSITGIAADLTPERWSEWVGAITAVGQDATLFLPRFEIEWGRNLKEVLRAAGVEDLFDPAVADLSRLSPQPGLFVDFVKQKTFVKVDEEGTEAAAVTGTGVGVTSAPPTFRVDRPFLFVLRERLSGTILFMGVVNDPAS